MDLMQWDYTVTQSVNASVFGFSWYLDALSKDWYGLITESYHHIMPVIFRTGRHRRVIDTTEILSSHPIYSRSVLSKDVNTHFLLYLKQLASHLHISLDKMVQFYEYAKLPTYSAPLFEIDLITSYQRKKTQFEPWMANELEYWGRRGYTARKLQEHKNSTQLLCRSTLHFQTTHPFNKAQLRKLTQKMNHYHLASFYSLYSPGGKSLATAMFVRSQNHIQLLGLSKSRLHQKLPLVAMIIDYFLQVNSEKPLTLCLDNLAGPNAPKILTALGAKQVSQTIVKHGSRSWFQRKQKHD